MFKKRNTVSGLKKWWDSITIKGSQQSQTNVEGNHNNSQSLTIEREIIPESPFTIVGTEKTGYWLTMGKHRITKEYKTKKEVMKKLTNPDWSIITSMIIAFVYDRKLVDEAYTRNTAIPPDEKSRQTAMDLNQ